MRKTAFFTMDVESFGDISCLREKNRAEYENFRVENMMADYLDLLDKYGIKATFFVVCSSLEYTGEYLARAVKGGHEIALHGLTHDIIAHTDREEIKRQLAEGKALLEREFNTKVCGYRAPCFAITNDVIEVVRELGFKYDSSRLDIKLSYVRSAAGFDGFERVCEGILKSENFYEISPCKVKTPFGTVNISGGGYLRLAPYSMVKRGIKKFLKTSDYYAFYCHPFDIFTGKVPPLKGISPLNAHYVKAGRKNFLSRTENIIKMLVDEGYAFSTIGDFLNTEI